MGDHQSVPGSPGEPQGDPKNRRDPEKSRESAVMPSFPAPPRSPEGGAAPPPPPPPPPVPAAPLPRRHRRRGPSVPPQTLINPYVCCRGDESGIWAASAYHPKNPYKPVGFAASRGRSQDLGNLRKPSLTNINLMFPASGTTPGSGQPPQTFLFPCKNLKFPASGTLGGFCGGPQSTSRRQSRPYAGNHVGGYHPYIGKKPRGSAILDTFRPRNGWGGVAPFRDPPMG